MIKIKKASIDDIPELLKLWKEMMDYHSKLTKKRYDLSKNYKKIMNEWFSKNLKSNNSMTLKAVIGSKIIGYSLGFIKEIPHVFKDNKIAFISEAYVLPEYRKKDVMKKIVEEMKKFYRKKSFKDIELKVNSKNILAVKAWSKMGFKENFKLMSMSTK